MPSHGPVERGEVVEPPQEARHRPRRRPTRAPSTGLTGEGLHAQDGRLCELQLRAWLDPGLVEQRSSCLVIHSQRLGLATRLGQRAHGEPPALLPGRRFPGQGKNLVCVGGPGSGRDHEITPRVLDAPEPLLPAGGYVVPAKSVFTHGGQGGREDIRQLLARTGSVGRGPLFSRPYPALDLVHVT